MSNDNVIVLPVVAKGAKVETPSTPRNYSHDDDPTPCGGCGLVETFDLLDSEMTEDRDNPQPTGRLLCIACYGPGWAPASDSDDIGRSIAPALAPHYQRWLSANPETDE